jgi:hypothetical protein
MDDLLAVVLSLRTQQRPCLGGGAAKARQRHETQPARRSAVGIYDTHCGVYSHRRRAAPASLSSLADGYFNTASGVAALYTNTHGYDNTASGADALLWQHQRVL